MRGSIGRIASSSSSNCTKQAFISSSSSSSSSYFSTFSGGGRGRGRGIIGSSDLPKTEFNSQAPGKPVQEDTLGQGGEDAPPGGDGVVGHGRGKPPLTSNPILSSFSSMISGMNQSTGRGRITQPPPPPISREPESQSGQPKNKPLSFVRGDATQPKNKPLTFVQGDATQPMEKPQFRRLDQNQEEDGISLKLPGMGRGKGVKDSASEEKRPAEENRHARRHPPKREEASSDVSSESSQRQPKMSRENAAKKAMGILSKDDGIREDGNRTRGKGGRRGARDGEGGMTLVESEVDDGGLRLRLGSDADGERLAQRLGPEKMAKLTAAFEEITDRLVPSPRDEAYLDALHTNNMIEFEPEYLVEFDNPDIDEKPPIPLRDALERMKPFLMVYEGIKSQEEWEEIIDELMTRVPAMKELIDYYCGPDTVTAKQQQQELERVAKTLPENVPPSVKRFTDRAVLSLQSNPGWGWDKKCQFMDKLVWEVSQQYK